jgi:hypothetical protein
MRLKQSHNYDATHQRRQRLGAENERDKVRDASREEQRGRVLNS